MIYIDTTPLESTTFIQHNKVRICMRINAKQKTMPPHSWDDFNINLTEYYNYCEMQGIDMIGHSLDRVGDNRNNYRCVISFYFESIADKACFVLKFV